MVKGKKKPLDSIEGQAAELKPGATIFLNGFAAVPGGKELFYFEIPLESTAP